MYIHFLIMTVARTLISDIFLIIANANLFIYNNLIGLIKKRSNSKFIISYIYKFKIFKLSSILFYYIY